MTRCLPSVPAADGVGPARAGRVPGLILVALLLGLVALERRRAAAAVSRRRRRARPTSSAPRARSSTCSRSPPQTHVAGSAADDQVVTDLVATLTGLGLDTRVQNAVGAYDFGRGSTEMARVRNVVGVPEGHATRPAGCT